MNKIVRYFSNADLRGGHDMLRKQATKAGVDLNNLDVGEFVLFVNKKQNMFKMLTQAKVMVFYKQQQRLHPATFALIPKYFNGKAIDYEGSLREALMRDFRVSQLPSPGNRLFREHLRSATTP
jgi:hypothetical protein